MAELLNWFWNRYRPQEGWLPLSLVLSLVICLIWALISANWVPEIGVVIPTGFCGLGLGVALAKRPLRTLLAWIILTLYGFLITILYLGNLWPPLHVLRFGWWTTAAFWQQNGALFLDRSVSWVQAATSGGRSEETIIFALGLGLITWFVAAYTGWCVYRQRQPMPGFMLIGTALTLNGYYSQVSAYWVVLFVGLAVMAIAIINYTNLERLWQQRSIDYSTEIRLELTWQAGALAIVLLSFSLALPSFSITEFTRFLARQSIVQEAEHTWDRVFGGVEEPRGSGFSMSAPGGGGIMPRAYLIGNPPELSDTAVMTAILEEKVDGRFRPVTNISGMHWRALSYEVYTGRGWTLSEEREETIPANQPIPLPPVSGQRTFRQSVNWIYDKRVIRYTIGFPLTFDQDVNVLWRGREDLVRITGTGTTYRTTTQVPAENAQALRIARVDQVPPTILARYTALPATVPAEVHALAQEVTENLDNPYDQARALERYLRQFPYSLDVTPPPANTDVVAYFLFEQQTGYCDYYASAMVVMARSLGLPARVAAGFLAQPPDENGIQTIYQIQAHSWAEVYFAGYGWVEFEPTATFPTSAASVASNIDPSSLYPEYLPDAAQEPLPIPNTPKGQSSPSLWHWGWVGLVLAAGVGMGIFWRWRQRQDPASEGVLITYGRFQQQIGKLGASRQPHQTPFEFRDTLFHYLAHFAQHPRLAPLVQQIKPAIEQLIAAFSVHQYGQKQDERTETAVAQDAWQQLKRPLRRLRLAHWLRTQIGRLQRDRKR